MMTDGAEAVETTAELTARVLKLEARVAELAFQNLDLTVLLQVLVHRHGLDEAVSIGGTTPEKPSDRLSRIWQEIYDVTG